MSANNLVPFGTKIRRVTGILKDAVLKPKKIVDPRQTYYPESPHKTKAEIIKDWIRYCMKYGYKMYDYYLYGLDVKGADPFQFVSERFNVEWLMAVHEQDNPNYVITMRDKCLFAQIMHDNHMPIPETYGMILNGQLHLQGDYSNHVPMERLLERDSHLLCKPVNGFSGEGIVPIRVKEGKLFHKGEELTIERFSSMVSGDTYLVQHFVENQHPAMKALFPNVLNTIRVTMVRTDEGIELLGVMCLMGSANSEYSNWHFGGICISVDEEGRLRKYGFSYSDKRITRHPDTGVEFEGYQLPYYKEMIELCTKAMDVFYGMKTIGWDMAITEDGPVFIEGNHRWGVVAHQMVDHRGWMDKYHRYFEIKK